MHAPPVPEAYQSVEIASNLERTCTQAGGATWNPARTVKKRGGHDGDEAGDHRGYRLLIQEGRRIGAQFTEDQWARTVDFDGWKNKEVLAHVAAVGSLVAPMAGGMANAAEGTNAGANIDIDALNAQLVSARAGRGAAELVDELAANYGAAIEWVRNAPDDLLKKRASFQGYENVEIGDLMMRMVVLHGLSHVYSAYSAVFNSGAVTAAAKTS